ncbi:MAG: hypothetical protein NVS2B7_31440 [Herpetosiphon sp.]
MASSHPVEQGPYDEPHASRSSQAGPDGQGPWTAAAVTNGSQINERAAREAPLLHCRGVLAVVGCVSFGGSAATRWSATPYQAGAAPAHAGSARGPTHLAPRL